MLNVAGRRQAPIPKVRCPWEGLAVQLRNPRTASPPLAGSNRIG